MEQCRISGTRYFSQGLLIIASYGTWHGKHCRVLYCTNGTVSRPQGFTSLNSLGLLPDFLVHLPSVHSYLDMAYAPKPGLRLENEGFDGEAALFMCPVHSALYHCLRGIAGLHGFSNAGNCIPFIRKCSVKLQKNGTAWGS